MPSSRKSTPRRGRSSSVVSNVSTTSAKQEPTSNSTPRRSKAAAAAAKDDGEATPSTPKAAAAAAAAARPALPSRSNPALPNFDVPVKLQVICRDGKNIIIGRVKLPTVGGTDHGFLLKRFDTDAIAASSMFRLAFPYADGEAERGEMGYLEKRFDTDVANGGRYKAPKRGRGRVSKKTLEAEELAGELPEGSTGVKLQGTWIPCADALAIAKEYGLQRFAQPLIEAKASQTDNGQPILTPSKMDKVSTPTSAKTKRSKVKGEESSFDDMHSSLTEASPTVTRTRTTKRVKEDGSEEVLVEKTETSLEPVGALSSAQIEAQIKEAQSLAKGIQSNGDKAPTSSRKRRAVTQTPTADLDPLADEEYESSNAVVRSLRKSGRAVRRRPIVTTAGALSAVGAGTLAWMAGGNLDVATQLVQQGVANLGSWFF